MKKFFARSISLLVALVMLVSLIPTLNMVSAVGDTITWTNDWRNYGGDVLGTSPYTLTSMWWPNTATSNETATSYVDVAASIGVTQARSTTTGSYRYARFYARNTAAANTWPNCTDALVIKTKVPAGTYKINHEFYKCNVYGDMAIYIGGQYAGTVYGYDAAVTAFADAANLKTAELNTLSLTPDANGFVDVVFRPLKRYYDNKRTVYYTPRTVTFTPVNACAFDKISHNIGAEMYVGESQEFSASALMTDGTTHNFADYDKDGNADTYDSVTLEQVGTSTAATLSNVTTTASEVSGKITAAAPGTISMKITAKIGTETKTENVTVTVKNPPKLASAELSLAKESIPVGRTTSATLALLRDDDEPYTDSYDVVYESSDMDVATVANDGTVTAVGEGTAKIKVSVTATDGSNIEVEDTADITVLPCPKLSEISVSTAKDTYVISEDGSSVISGTMDDGIAATATELAAYTFTYENDDESVITLNTATGAFKVIGEGTAEITATTTNENGKTIFSRKVVAVKANADNINIDFSLTTTVNNGKWEATVTPGYEIVKEKSNLGIWRKYSTWPDKISRLHISTYTGSNFWPVVNTVNAQVTIAVDFPVAGWYSAYLSGGRSYYGGWYSAFGNESYLGDYNFYSEGKDTADWEAGPEKRLNTAYYKSGKNEITFYVRGTVYSTPYLLLQSLKFVPSSEPALAEIVSAIPETLAVGEIHDITAVARMSDGSDFNIGVNADGTTDTANTITVTSDNSDVLEISDVKGYEPGASGEITYKINAKSAGSANVKLSATVNGKPVEKTVPVTVSLENLASTEITGIPPEMYIGQEAELSAANTLESGRVLTDGIAESIFTSKNPEIAEVSGNKLIAKSEGIAEIEVKTTFLGVTKYATKQVEVTDEIISEINITAGGSEHIRLTDDAKDTVPLYVVAKTNKGREIDLTNIAMTYEALNPELADIAEDGTIYPKAEGEAEFRVSFELDGNMRSEKKTLTVARAKSGFNYYTAEERAAARENKNKYDWAKKTVESATARADMYVEQADVLYNMITSEGIPRAMTIAPRADPEAYICKYCGTDIREGYGNYAYIINALSRPWKIQCPDCKRVFPSNDFGSLYKLGLNEYGEYSADRARAENQKLIDEGFFAGTRREKYGYLTNELYPEIGTEACPVKLNPGEDPLSWGADDGLGYVTGKVHENGVVERYNFIAYYLHWGVYRSSTGFSTGHVYNAINNTALAYVYTGNKKYGRVAAILLDRIADFYPGYDRSIYGADIEVSDGGALKGKILGRIWETGALGALIKCYDAVYDMYDDPEVQSFLGKKSQSIKMRHAKNTPSQIRTNIEDGLIRDGLEAIRRNQVAGNFGYPQQTNAIAAVILDSMPETKYWLDYLMAPGWTNKGDISPGGGISNQLVDVVDHDGQGNEGSNYNTAWLTSMLNIQDALDDYDAYSSASLYNNPKFVRMFYCYIPMIMSSYTPEIGDTASTADRSLWLSSDVALTGYRKLKDDRFAQYVYMLSGNSIEGIHESIFTKDPEKIQDDIKRVIAEKGTLYAPSEMLTGFGFAALRDGVDFSNVTAPTQMDNRHGFWMYFGYNGGHGHTDSLGIGMDAFGLNFMPDLGYPEETGTQPNRLQWVGAVLSHNTVMVDGKDQTINDVRGTSHHFDDSGIVQLMDTDAKACYPQTDIYRRSVVMIKLDDDNFYGVDFFRIKGGDDHLYSLHTLSDEICETSGLDLVPQMDENGEYKGSYVGIDVPYGPDPNSPAAWTYNTVYPRGYTWLENVDRDSSQTEQFEADFKIKDFKKALKGNAGNLHLRATMLSIGEGTTVATADGYPPKKAENSAIPSLRYLLVQRKGTDLDTTFTTVLEPYRDARTLSSVEEMTLTIKDGAETAADTHRAVKVTQQNGTVDYVFYATNNEVTYTLSDNGKTIDFRGFVGVYRLKNDVNIYKYVCDGDIIGESTGTAASIKGRIANFTQELSFNNEIRVKPSVSVTEEVLPELANKYIYVDNSGSRNGAYRIESASLDGNELVLNIGTATLIRQYKDITNLDGGFIYNIERREDCVIPLSYSDANLPVFDAISNASVSAGSVIEVLISAHSPLENVGVTINGASLPRGASFDSETNTFKWKPDGSQIGENRISLTAVDDYGRESTIHFIVKVLGSTTGAGGGGGGGGGEQQTPDTPDTPDAPDAPDTPDTPEQTGFTDLDGFDWAKDAINALAEDGIIKGMSENTFVPGANITRADFAILLVRAFKLSGAAAENFADVLESDYFAEELAIAKESGIIGGIGDNKYAPRNAISREDMMVIVYRALKRLGFKLEAGEVTASDFETLAPYARDAVMALMSNGLVNGKNGLIDGKANTTRAEVAVLLKRVLDFAQQ